MIRKKVNHIMRIMESIEYGYRDKKGNNILLTDPNRWSKEFDQFYELLAPEELLKTKCGVCWDQVELERKLFQDNHIFVRLILYLLMIVIVICFLHILF